MGCEVLGISSWVTQAGVVRLGVGVGVGDGWWLGGAHLPPSQHTCCFLSQV